MLPFLSFVVFFMAVILPSGRSSKGKVSAEAPLQLEQHLPKSAHTLISSLSVDDREVLLYMLAFGLHLQILAGLVLPASKLQWKPWKASYVKVGVKRDPSHSLQSMSGKSRLGPQKTSLFAHKPSCSCDCFSCYSSFWSRWASSPNRDLLNMIIEIAEMADVEEEQKAGKGKEKKKKPEKKRIVELEAGGKKAKGGKWTPKISATLSPSGIMAEAISATEIANDASGCTSMDVMYDALWDSGSKDEAPQLVARIMDGSVMLTEHHIELKDRLPVLPHRTTMKVKNLWEADTLLEASSWASPKQQGKASAMVEDKVDGSSATQTTSPNGLLFPPMQGKNNSKFQRAGKRKSNQITPLVFEDAFILPEEDQESNVSSDRAEGSLCCRVADANLRGKGFFSRIFPDALCGIASRLWDLVSMGSRNRSMDYY